MRKRRIERRQNPSVLDLATIVAVGGIGLFIISKIKTLNAGSFLGGVFNPVIPGIGGIGPSPVSCDGSPQFKVDGSFPHMSPNNLIVTWHISHCGPPGVYWAGSEILINGRTYTAEKDFTVSNDNNWSSWRMSAALNFGAPEASIVSMRVYIADAQNNRLAEKIISNPLPILFA